MKHFSLLALLVLIFTFSQAQDTIVKSNGDQIFAKILEISTTEVKYKKFDFQDGPIFIENKSDIQLIKYSNGSKDEFEIQPNNIYKTKDSKTDYYARSVNSNSKIESHDNRFRYNGKMINEPKLHMLLLTRNDPQITLLKNSARRYKKLQYIGLGALPFGLASLVSYAYPPDYIGGAILGGKRYKLGEPAVVTGLLICVAVSLPIAAIYFKHKRNVANAQAIELYNSKL